MLELGPFVWDLAFCGGFRLEKKGAWPCWIAFNQKHNRIQGSYTYILMVCFFWAFRENAIILVVSGNLSRFRKKSRFVEFCSWPWPFTLIGTGCRTCWLPRNLFDKTLLHSQSSRSFSRYLKPNYSNEACPRTHCRYIGYFGSPRAMVYALKK